MSNTDSPQVKLTYEMVRGFESGGVDMFAKHVHKDFRYITYPRSVGKLDQTGEEWLQELAQNWNVLTGKSKASHFGSYSNIFSPANSLS